jgi:hypothetical protein
VPEDFANPRCLLPRSLAAKSTTSPPDGLRSRASNGDWKQSRDVNSWDANKHGLHRGSASKSAESFLSGGCQLVGRARDYSKAACSQRSAKAEVILMRLINQFFDLEI